MIPKPILIILVLLLNIIYMVCISTSRHLEDIGSINSSLNPKKNKKIDVSGMKIFIPRNEYIFHRKLKFFDEEPYQEKEVFKTTFVLTVINYVHDIISCFIPVVAMITLKKWMVYCYLGWNFIWSVLLLVIMEITKYKFEKRLRNEGVDFKME